MYIPKHLHPNPRAEGEFITGAQVVTPFAWLAGHVIESLSVNGVRLVSVDKEVHAHDELMHVTCTDDAGEEHMFVYDPDSLDDDIDHVRLGKPDSE